MNIYELEGQATPGPWSQCPHTIDSVLGYPTGDHMGSRTVSCGSCCNIPITQRSENAALIVHCRNNFMRALETLKALAESQKHNQENIDCSTIMNCDAIDELIAELEEVK